MKAAKILAWALLPSALVACSAAGPENESTTGADRAVAAAEQATTECHHRPPVCTDTNPSCTAKHRAASTSDSVEARLAQLCFPMPFDWRESNSDGSKFIEETFFFCPDTPALHAFVDVLSWDVAHTTSDACGPCIPSLPRGFTYAVVHPRENAPNCGNTCPGPTLVRW